MPGSKFENVWVFYKGDRNMVTKDRGVRYLSTCGFDVENLTPENKKQHCTSLLPLW